MRSIKIFLVCTACLLAVSACSKSSILNATVSSAGYSVHKNISYGKDARQTLDVYIPDTLSKPAPVVVFFYGGRWQSGKKEDYVFVAQAFASHGYVVVVPDYRLYPEHYFPDFMNDGASAVAWTHNHIADYQGDPTHLFLAGHSAGAHIAVMLGVNDQYIKLAGGKRSWISGVIGIAGPYDFLPFTDADVKDIFSKRPEKQSQPINYVTRDAPPMLLTAGDADEDVKPKNTINMAKALRSKGNEVEEHIYPGVAHLGIVLSLSELFRDKTPLLDQADHFIHRH